MADCLIHGNHPHADPNTGTRCTECAECQREVGAP